MSDFGHFPVLLFSLLPGLLLVAGVIIVVVLGLRALFSIDRSLKQLVEQGVARGEGPFGRPPAG